jgi:NMD protein affecting ribosome stability and mRNA decay
MSSRSCVRCGRRPRALESFLCVACLADPDAHVEAATALHIPDPDRARRFAIEVLGWAGGWGRFDRA